jgi:hypothetical protein
MDERCLPLLKRKGDCIPTMNNLHRLAILVCLTLLSIIAGQRSASGQQLLSFLDVYCVDCHSGDAAEGGISLDEFQRSAEFLSSGKRLLRVFDVVQSGSMPPEDASQPSTDERYEFTQQILDALMNDAADQSGSPGGVIRRLNRQEYDNTIADLIGIRLDLAKSFPPDDIGFGYDNIGSALNISPVHVERYLQAAEIATEKAIVTPDPTSRAPVELIGLRTYPLPIEDSVVIEHELTPGRYFVDFSLVRVGVPESTEPPRLVIGLGTDRRVVRAAQIQDETVVYRLFLAVKQGNDQAYISILDEDREASAAALETIATNVSGDKRYGSKRGYHVDSIVVRGPLGLESVPDSHSRILFCVPGDGDESRLDCARRIMARFATAAFRRPVDDVELEQLMRVVRVALQNGESFEQAVRLSCTAVLVSPQFLFLVEPTGESGDRRLNDYELASRLSYFLWSTMPDQALLDAAADGTLRSDLRNQVTRLLADPKSQAFVENFTGQWLQLRNLQGVAPDRDLYPQFDDDLVSAMRKETEQFFAYVLRQNRSVLELLDADYTFVNERLARHYGIAAVAGPEFRKVSLSESPRGGVLTQASVLALTSNHNRTSPVKRGQWVLQQLLGTPPPPPPPDVAQLDDSPRAAKSASLRERLEVHRSNPECASCHSQMDSIGFGLENFDAIGGWRTLDGDFPIDASGKLPGDLHFSGVAELKSLLKSTAQRRFSWCLIENLLTYGLGRALEPTDYVFVEAVRQRLEEHDFRIQEILFAIVESDAFQRRGVSN